MRNVIIEHLAAAAKTDTRIVLLTADLGFGVIESFRDQHPDRFYNVGVSEQSMISAATGLAHMGMIPYCYSIATFASLRALEFLRNGPVAHSLPVRVIGVGPGFDYANDGLTHYAIEDVAALRVMPNVLIWAPTSAEQIADGFPRVHQHQGLVYLRTPRVENRATADRLFTAGAKVCVISFGDSHIEARRVEAQLSTLGVETDAVNCQWIQNEPDALIRRILGHYPIVVSVENHYVRGGFGSVLLEFASQLEVQPRVVIHGVEKLPVGALGDRGHLADTFMTSPAVTSERVMRLLNA